VSAPRHCVAYPCTANAPSPRRGPAEPSNALSVTTQGYTMTSGRRERPSPSLSVPCGHPRHCSSTPRTSTASPTLLGRTGVGRRHTCHCTSYGPPWMTPSSRSADDGRTANHYNTTLEAAPVRAQDASRRHDWNKIRQDGRQLHGTARHASTRKRIVWHACKSLSPWPIKGRAIPNRRGRHATTDSDHIHAFRLRHDISTCVNQYHWDLEARPPLPPRL
jgi:hypothetical protein